MARQFPVKLLFQPLPGFMVLTGWAVAVSAGTEDNRGFFTLVTTVDGYAAGFGTTGDNGRDNLPVIGRYFS